MCPVEHAVRFIGKQRRVAPPRMLRQAQHGRADRASIDPAPHSPPLIRPTLLQSPNAPPCTIISLPAGLNLHGEQHEADQRTDGRLARMIDWALVDDNPQAGRVNTILLRLRHRLLLRADIEYDARDNDQQNQYLRQHSLH